MEIEFILI